jgi:hypothetical protein
MLRKKGGCSAIGQSCALFVPAIAHFSGKAMV